MGSSGDIRGIFFVRGQGRVRTAAAPVSTPFICCGAFSWRYTFLRTVAETVAHRHVGKRRRKMIVFLVNGKEQRVDVSPETPLLWLSLIHI